jgi:hypothetical protein
VWSLKLTDNNSMQRTALRAAADAERYMPCPQLKSEIFNRKKEILWEYMHFKTSTSLS